MINQLTQTPTTVQTLDLSTSDSVNVVARLIVSGSKSPKVRDFTVNLIRDRGLSLYPFSIAMVDVVYQFCNQEVEYVKDISKIETFYSAEKILENRYGDCDDKVIIGGSMLRTLGMDICIVLLDLSNQESYDHIMLLAGVENKWIPFDASMQNGSLGRMAPVYYRAKIHYLY